MTVVIIAENQRSEHLCYTIVHCSSVALLQLQEIVQLLSSNISKCHSNDVKNDLKYIHIHVYDKMCNRYNQSCLDQKHLLKGNAISLYLHYWG